MATPTETPPGDFLQAVEQIRSHVLRLDSRLHSALRGLGILAELDMIVQAMRKQLDAAEVTAKQVTAKMQQLQKLVDTSALITSSLELSQVLDEVMDTVINLTGAERAFLVLRETEGSELNIQAARNWGGASLNAAEI